jgi:hypothetical protein
MFSSDKVGRWLPAGVALLAAGAMMVSLGGRLFDDPEHFTPAAWRSGSPAQRGRMARSLCAGGLLRDKTRAEVIDILGEPDRDFGPLFEYDIVSPRPSPHAEWVHIGFDRTNGRVFEVEVRD